MLCSMNTEDINIMTAKLSICVCVFGWGMNLLFPSLLFCAKSSMNPCYNDCGHYFSDGNMVHQVWYICCWWFVYEDLA